MDTPLPTLIKMHSRPHLSRASKCTRHIERKHVNGKQRETREQQAVTLPTYNKHETHSERDIIENSDNSETRFSMVRRSSWFLENRSDSAVLGNRLTGNKFKKVGKLIIQAQRRPTGYGYGPSETHLNLEEFDREYDFDADGKLTL